MGKLRLTIQSLLACAITIFFVATIVGATTIGDNISSSGSLTVYGDSTFATSTLFVDSTNMRVGIGTTTPDAKLSVSGSLLISGTSGYLNFGFTPGTNGYGFRSNSGTLQYKNVGGSWANLGSGGSGSGVWSTSSNNIYYTLGNVGIGSSTPNMLLSVGGYGDFAQGLCIGGDCITNWNSAGAFDGSGVAGQIAAWVDGNTLTGSGTLQIAYGGTGAVTVSSARANLGLAIGSDIQAWDQGLDDIAGLATTTNLFMVANGTTWSTQDEADVRTTLGLAGIYSFAVNASSTWGDVWIAQGQGSRGTWAATNSLNISLADTSGTLAVNRGGTGLISSGGAGYFLVGLDANTFDATSSIYLDTVTKYIGIGTTTPDAKLSVSGDLMIAASFSYLNFGFTPGTNGYGFRNNSGTLQYKNAGGSWADLGTGTGGSGVWSTSSNDIYYTLGNVGIGTASPQYDLDVYGDINISGNGTYKVDGVSIIRSSRSRSSNYIGSSTADINPSGNYNNFFGNFSGRLNSTGYGNTFIGHQSGQNNTAGYYNSFLGTMSGLANSTGDYNVFVGYSAGAQNAGGNNNTFLGNGAGYGNMSGSNNVFLGFEAGYFETGSNRLYIENSSTTTPLIYGEFDNNYLKVNGNFAITVSGYINFGSATSSSGYGIRDNAGTLQYKNVGGSWNDIGTSSGMGASTWTENGSDLYYTTGYIGIGTSSPQAEIHIYDITPYIYLQSPQKQLTIGLDAFGPAFWATGNSSMSFYTNGVKRLIITGDGNVGIGTSSPTADLKVYGGAAATSTVEIGDDIMVSNACLKLRDSDGAGWTYCTTLDGSLNCTSTPCN